jgi:hypothetical protein
MKFGYAAEQSESSLGAVTTGIRFLQRNMIAAGQGSKEAQAAFERAGVSIEALRGKSATQQLLILADAFKNIPDAATRTATAIGLFGRSGQDLVPLLKQGSTEINRLMRESEALGNTMSGREVKAADDLADSWDRLKTAIQAVSISIGSAFGPAVRAVLDDATRIVKGLEVAWHYYIRLMQGDDAANALILAEHNQRELDATLAKAGAESEAMLERERQAREQADRDAKAAAKERAADEKRTLAEMAKANEEYERERISEIRKTEEQARNARRKQIEESFAKDLAGAGGANTVQQAKIREVAVHNEGRYQGALRYIEDERKAGRITDEEAFNRRKTLEGIIAKSRTDFQKAAIDSEIAYLDEQRKSPLTSPVERVKIEAEIEAAGIRKKTIDEELANRQGEIGAGTFTSEQIQARVSSYGTFSGERLSGLGGGVAQQQLDQQQQSHKALLRIADASEQFIAKMTFG